MQESEIGTLLEYLRTTYQTLGEAGWIAMLGVLFYGFVHTYRLAITQRLLGWLAAFKPLGFVRHALWATMGEFKKLLVVAVPTGLAAFFLTVHAEGSWNAWFPALMSALSAVAGAMGIRKTQKVAVPAVKATAVKVKAVVAKLKRKP